MTAQQHQGHASVRPPDEPLGESLHPSSARAEETHSHLRCTIHNADRTSEEYRNARRLAEEIDPLMWTGMVSAVLCERGIAAPYLQVSEPGHDWFSLNVTINAPGKESDRLLPGVLKNK